MDYLPWKTLLFARADLYPLPCLHDPVSALTHLIGAVIFLFLGLGMLLFPIDRDRLRAEHGVDKPLTLAHYPLSWKILVGVAVAAGLANWVAIAQL